MEFEFVGEAISWRGPAPFVFIPVPTALSAEIKAVSAMVTYGWGVIPVKVRIGEATFTTSLFPKGDVYLVPVKAIIQKSQNLAVGDSVNVFLEIEVSMPS